MTEIPILGVESGLAVFIGLTDIEKKLNPIQILQYSLRILGHG